MPFIIDITDQRFGKLVAKEIVGKYNRSATWRCLCDCGREVVVRVGNLRRGNTSSCGCLRGKKHE